MRGLMDSGLRHDRSMIYDQFHYFAWHGGADYRLAWYALALQSHKTIFLKPA
jgi:hypothetical protein